MKNYFFLVISTSILFTNSCISQENPPLVSTPDQSKFSTELIVDGIESPWGMDFISENDFLATEKKGVLYRVVNGVKKEVSGLPKIYVRGQGGLLDVAIHPDFKSNGIIYFTAAINIEGDNGGNTGLYLAELEGYELKKVELLYKATPNTKKGQHFGSRIVFDNDGHLFFSVGDRGNRDVNPQNLEKDGGKIYRLKLDGTIPEDNPFVNKKGGIDAIYSYGHRNPQGMIFHYKTGELWEHEHGPRGGDEINIIRERDSIREEPLLSRNYGWPIVSNGINYNGTSFTDISSLEGTESPSYFWTPSIAPSGMTMLTSDIYDKWKGNLFIGSLRFRYLERIELIGNYVYKREKLLDRVGRVREVVQGPDGFLYVGIENKGVFKLVPSKVDFKIDIIN